MRRNIAKFIKQVLLGWQGIILVPLVWFFAGEKVSFKFLWNDFWEWVDEGCEDIYL